MATYTVTLSVIFPVTHTLVYICGPFVQTAVTTVQRAEFSPEIRGEDLAILWLWLPLHPSALISSNELIIIMHMVLHNPCNRPLQVGSVTSKHGSQC